MSLRRLTNRVSVLPMACVAFVAIVAGTSGAQVLPLTSADGSVIEINKPSGSTRFVGAAAVWVLRSYPISADCRPPPGCYAKSQVINYHFNCSPRYVVVAERISLDLNGDAVKHEVLEPGGTYELGYVIDGELIDTYCPPLPDAFDLRDLRERQTPDPGGKPRKKLGAPDPIASTHDDDQDQSITRRAPPEPRQ